MKKCFIRYIGIVLICCIVFLCFGCTTHQNDDETDPIEVGMSSLEKPKVDPTILQAYAKRLQNDFPDADVSIKEDEIVVVRPMDLEQVDLPINAHDGGTYRVFESWQKEREFIRLDHDIVVLAKKAGSSKQVTKFNGTMLCTSFYCETPIEILDVFYGDMRKGEQITLREEAAVLTDMEGKEAIQTYGTPIVRADQTYLMVLQPIPALSSENKTMYGESSYKHIFPIDDEVKNAKTRDALIKVLDERREHGANANDKIFADLMAEYIYPKEPDLRINEMEEIRKMVSQNISFTQKDSAERGQLTALRDNEDATKEQLREGLTDEQRELLDRMVKKYGTLSRATEK